MHCNQKGAAGAFQFRGEASRKLAKPSGAWNALPNQGLNDDVRALAVVGGDLYAGGDFTQTGDGALTNLGYIVRFSISGEDYHNVYLPLLIR